MAPSWGSGGLPPKWGSFIPRAKQNKSILTRFIQLLRPLLLFSTPPLLESPPPHHRRGGWPWPTRARFRVAHFPTRKNSLRLLRAKFPFYAGM